MINLIRIIRARWAAHHRYRQTIDEIEALADKELVEFGAFQFDLKDAARDRRRNV